MGMQISTKRLHLLMVQTQSDLHGRSCSLAGNCPQKCPRTLIPIVFFGSVGIFTAGVCQEFVKMMPGESV